MLAIVVDLYGTDCFVWDPRTLALELADDVGPVEPRNFDRLMVGINLITSDSFYQSLPDFINYCNVLAGDSYDPNMWDPADAVEIAWGITESALIDPPESDNPFSEEIIGYIQAVLDAEGIVHPPAILRLAANLENEQRVDGGFSDDPEMFSMVYEYERSKTDDIDNIVKNGLIALNQQLSSVNLTHGNTRDAVPTALSFGKENGYD